MRAFIAFTKKEFVESIRTYKLLIIFSVFLLFGMLNPITAKITPELLSAFMPEGVTITLPEPSSIDSWTQFYKNMSMQIIVFIIVFCGIIVNELSKGTLVNMITKGLSRKTVILSKFTAVFIVWTLSYILCFTVTLGYTTYLLQGELQNIIFSASCMWLYGVLLITVMLLGGVLFSNIYGSLLVTGGFSVLLMLLNIIPKVQKYSPYRLTSDNLGLLTNNVSPSDFYIPILISLLIIGLMITLTLIIFDKKKL